MAITAKIAREIIKFAGSKGKGEAVKKYGNTSDVKSRILNQMTRELLLAQSSDWAFMMKTGHFSEYAGKRTVTHLERFYLLHSYLERDFVNFEVIEEREFFLEQQGAFLDRICLESVTRFPAFHCCR